MKKFNEIRAPKIKKGLRDKKGKLHTVNMKLDGSKLSFRVTDEFGSFKTVNAKGLARMFERCSEVDKFIEEARGYGKKPVSMMTPAEKKKDAERRKEYKAYQKSKREDVEEGAFYGRDDLVKQFKPTKAQKKLNVRLVRNKRGGMERATLNIKKDAAKIKQLKKDGYKVDPTYHTEDVNENYNQDLTLATKNVARLAQKETGQDKKDYMAVSRALSQGNLGAVKKVIKGISTKEIQADILNILVGYNDLIAKMYPKATDAKGNLKSGLSVDKMIQEQNCGCGKTPCETYGNVDEAMNPKDKAKRLKLIKKAVERINKNNAEKAKKDALKMMKDSGMFDESVELEEKWKMGDGRPRNGARIENDRFWNLPKKSLEFIRKDASDAMKANPKGKKAGKYADEVNDAETVLGWRKKNSIRESVEITEAKQSYVDQMRDIVAKKSAKKINGVMVDMFTASAVVKVYDAINDTNKAKMDKMTVPAMANVAFKLLKK